MPPPATSAAPRPLPHRPTRPPAEVRFNVIFWLILALLSVPLIYELVIGQYRILFERAWIGGFGTMFLAFTIVHRFGRLRIARRFLRPYAGFRCPRCHYPLGKIPDADICPECGTSCARPAVVALWESSYGMGHIFPRAAPGLPSALDVAAIPSLANAAPGAPDSAPKNINIHTALESIEAAARAKGLSSPRFPAYARDLDGAIAGLGRPIPPDLYTFYAWFDPALWSSLVRPAGASSAPAAETFEALATAQADPIQIRHPSMIRAYGARASSRAGPAAPTPIPASWGDTPIVAFADTPRGETILYCIDAPPSQPDSPEIPRGAIVAISPAAADRPVLLAPSLATWLARIAAEGTQES